MIFFYQAVLEIAIAICITVDYFKLDKMFQGDSNA
jgi:hypothetical protein